MPKAMSEATPGSMEQAIANTDPMLLIGGTAGLHMAQCVDHGLADCPLLRAALVTVVTRAQSELLAALEAYFLRDTDEIAFVQRYGKPEFEGSSISEEGFTERVLRVPARAAIAHARGEAVKS